jgi:hypothetical protein
VATLPEDVRRGCRIPATVIDKAPKNQKFPAPVASVQPSRARRDDETAHMNPAFWVRLLHWAATISPQLALTIGSIHLLFAVSVRLAFTDQRPEKPHQSTAVGDGEWLTNTQSRASYRRACSACNATGTSERAMSGVKIAKITAVSFALLWLSMLGIEIFIGG